MSEMAKITSLGIVTLGRPEALERCALSYAADLRRFGRDVRLLVLDDAQDPRSSDRCKRMLERLQRSQSVPIRYAGVREKRRFGRRLIQSGAPSDLRGRPNGL